MIQTIESDWSHTLTGGELSSCSKFFVADKNTKHGEINLLSNHVAWVITTYGVTVGVTDSPMPCHITRGTGPAVAACVATKHASRNMANIVRLFAASKL